MNSKILINFDGFKNKKFLEHYKCDAEMGYIE